MLLNIRPKDTYLDQQITNDQQNSMLSNVPTEKISEFSKYPNAVKLQTRYFKVIIQGSPLACVYMLSGGQSFVLFSNNLKQTNDAFV